MASKIYFTVEDFTSSVKVPDKGLCETLKSLVNLKVYDKHFVFDIPDYTAVHAGLVADLIMSVKTQGFGFMEIGDFIKLAQLSGLNVKFTWSHSAA